MASRLITVDLDTLGSTWRFFTRRRTGFCGRDLVNLGTQYICGNDSPSKGRLRGSEDARDSRAVAVDSLIGGRGAAASPAGTAVEFAEDFGGEDGREGDSRVFEAPDGTPMRAAKLGVEGCGGAGAAVADGPRAPGRGGNAYCVRPAAPLLLSAVGSNSVREDGGGFRDVWDCHERLRLILR